jgi:hypothetical protein
MRWYKVLGLAAFAGVAATGAVIVRDQRRRRTYTPDEVRDRLHARLAETPVPRQPRPTPSRRHQRPHRSRSRTCTPGVPGAERLA